MVSIEDTIKGFNMIMDGEVDYLPEQAFLNVGTIEEAIEKGKKLLETANKKELVLYETVSEYDNRHSRRSYFRRRG